MKNVFALLVCTLVVSGTALASFPVQSIQDATTENITETTVEETNDEVVATPVDKKEVKAEKKAAKAELKKMKKDAKRKAKASGADKEFWITLALWFFLGFLAGHRWYRGKPAGWNILYILTAGGFGIWAIVDLIFILTGKF